MTNLALHPECFASKHTTERWYISNISKSPAEKRGPQCRMSYVPFLFKLSTERKLKGVLEIMIGDWADKKGRQPLEWWSKSHVLYRPQTSTLHTSFNFSIFYLLFPQWLWKQWKQNSSKDTEKVVNGNTVWMHFLSLFFYLMVLEETPQRQEASSILQHCSLAANWANFGAN